MTWSIDPAHTSVGFSARHLALSTVRGSFGDVSLEDVHFDPDDLTASRGSVVVNTASLRTGDDRRDGHLRGADFLDIENHPTMSFSVTDVQKSGDTYAVTGDLTIRGVTHSVTLDGEFAGISPDPWGNKRAGASLTGTINRKEWGLKWNVAVEGGGLMVSEKVKLEIEFQLVEQQVPAAAG